MPPWLWQAPRGEATVSKRWARLLAGIVQGASLVQKPGRRGATRLLAAELLLQRQTVATAHGDLVFLASHPQALDYPRHFATREPETIAWIDAFETPAAYWDVGANIGLYALYAGLRQGVEVLAFEPAAANYQALCRNIAVNGLGHRVRAYCVALGDATALGRLNLSATNPGSVYHAFDSSDDCFGRPLDIVESQGMIGFSIDGFRRTFGLPPPNYLKIDVDSTEERIVAGAAETLREPALRSVLIELEERDTPRKERLVSALATAGLELVATSAGGRGGTVNGIFARRHGEPV
jgi:FkbM family methyltransferase